MIDIDKLASLGGHIYDEKNIQEVLSKQKYPMLAGANGSIKGSGRGKSINLADYLIKVLGKYPTRTQTIGDCFLSGTKVLMNDSTLKSIENIRTGDFVVSHTGEIRQVVNTIKKKYTGKIHKIKACGYHQELEATSDHKFITYDYNGYGKLNNYYWQSISNLSVKSNMVLTPYGNKLTKESNFIYKDEIIKIDEDLAWLIGIYLAEGGVSGLKSKKKSGYNWHKVVFNLCTDEENYADRIIDICKKKFNTIGKKQYHKSYQHVLLVEFYDSVFSKFIKDIIPGNVYSKRVPKEFLLTTESIKLALIRGWIDGDGCINIGENEKRTFARVNGISSSYNLIDDIYLLSSACKLNPRIATRKKASHQNIAARTIDFYSTCALKVIPEKIVRINPRLNQFTEFGIARQIEKLTSYEVVDIDVYCIEVEEDHSFIANGFAVHNCVSQGCAGAVDILKAISVIENGNEFGGLTSSEAIYGLAKHEISHDQWKGMDGTSGASGAQACKFGTLLQKQYGKYDLTNYSGQRARDWGNTGLPDELEPIAREHPVKTISMVNTYYDAIDCLHNGYVITVASSVGFDSSRDRYGKILRDKDGVIKNAGSWNHQMMLCGYVDDNRPRCLCVNSWGDFCSGGPSNMFEGSFYIEADVVERMLGMGDSFALSSFEAFPAQKLNLRLL